MCFGQWQSMRVGCARVPTRDQTPVLQRDALKAAGCSRIWDQARPATAAAMSESATLVVWRLDRLSRAPDQPIEIVKGWAGRGIGLRSLTEAIDTATTSGRLVLEEGRSFGNDTP